MNPIGIKGFVLILLLMLTACIPESHWKKKYEVEFQGVCEFQDASFSAVLFGMQGIQKALYSDWDSAYSEWPSGFDSLTLKMYQGVEFYYLSSEGARPWTQYQNGIPNKMEIYLDKNWPNPGSGCIILYNEDTDYYGGYTLRLSMEDTLSSDSWKMHLSASGIMDQYFPYSGTWKGEYKVLWNRKNASTFEDDCISFAGLGKHAVSNRRRIVDFIVSDTLYLQSGSPGIWGDKLKIFAYNLPMVSISQEQYIANFPDSYLNNNYQTQATGQAQDHIWADNYKYRHYSGLLKEGKIVRK